MLTELSDGLERPDREEASQAEERLQLVTFMVGSRSYAVDILAVREIRQPSHMTRLPNQPAWVRGVLNLRGAIVPIHDLGVRFGGDAIEVADLTVIVIIQVGKRIIGMMVDTVLDIVSVNRNEIRPIPSGTTIDSVSGLMETDQGTVTVLDLDALFPIDLGMGPE